MSPFQEKSKYRNWSNKKPESWQLQSRCSWLDGVLEDPGSSHFSTLSSLAVRFWPQIHHLLQLLQCPTSYDHRTLIKAGRKGERARGFHFMKPCLINKVNPLISPLHWLRAGSCAHPGPIIAEGEWNYCSY